MTQETLQTRRADRCRRLEAAIASARRWLDIMPTFMERVGFVSTTNPPTDGRLLRETVERLVEATDELRDASEAFMCFCDCQTHGGE
jgi:hypothetical protein